jgi:hypothetical protein
MVKKSTWTRMDHIRNSNKMSPEALEGMLMLSSRAAKGQRPDFRKEASRRAARGNSAGRMALSS